MANQTSRNRLPPLLVIVGETASGKSSLAMKIAKEVDGEIIAADSRTVYRGMDIGTAKASRQDKTEVRHHMLDIVDPDTRYTAAQFKLRTLEVIENITSRGKIPIMVGGTGLYVDSVIFDYKFGSAPNPAGRAKLAGLSDDELKGRALELGTFLDSQTLSNRRHLVRLIETDGEVKQDRKLRQNTYLVGLKTNRAQLRKQIEKRVETMFKQGLRKELDVLLATYNWHNEALSGIGYQEFEEYYEGKISMTKVKQNIVKNTIKFAKRQRTWFKRNVYINWFEDRNEAKEAAISFIKKQSNRGE